MKDGFFPCAFLSSKRNCKAGGLYTFVNTALADLSQTLTTNGVRDYNDKFVSGFVRPGCHLELWTELDYEGQYFTSGFNNSFDFADNTGLSSLKCSCPVSDKDVLSCVPTMEWVVLAECESNETHSTPCGFTATSKVLSNGQDSVDDPLKEALYDLARYYSANPLHKPKDETGWYQYRDRRPYRRFKVEQQVARCGHYEVHLRVFNVTVVHADSSLSNWIWTAPSKAEGTSATSTEATTESTWLSTLSSSTEAILDHSSSLHPTTDGSDAGSTAGPATDLAFTSPSGAFSEPSSIATEAPVDLASSVDARTSTDGSGAVTATFPTSSSSTTVKQFSISGEESKNTTSVDPNFANATLGVTDTLTSQPTVTMTSAMQYVDSDASSSSKVPLASSDALLMILVLACTLVMVSLCAGVTAWTYRRRRKTGRYDVALIRFSATTRSVEITGHLNEENVDGDTGNGLITTRANGL